MSAAIGQNVRRRSGEGGCSIRGERGAKAKNFY